MKKNKVMTVEKLRNRDFKVKINRFSVEDMVDCFALSIAHTIIQTYPNDPSFLLEFHIILMKKTQYYFNKLSKKENYRWLERVSKCRKQTY